MGASQAAVQFDGEFFAVSCRGADCQPDGPDYGRAWSELDAQVHFPAALAGWYGPCEIELVEASHLACDGYIAEPVPA